MATRKKSAPVRNAAPATGTASSTKAVATTGKSGVQAGKTTSSDKRRVWDYIKKNNLQDKAKRTT